ncbi:unnamed protein product [Didymodactylos carnosus]|nr:unnamed protein product [Didymodactylos carnosus]CAF3926722.1 unnamed protein product [Didymodactylos carnosus]
MEYKATLDHNLKMPRLIIYIDKSPEEIWDRMQREGKDYQKKSKVYSLEFLRTMDRIMKDEFLPRMSSFCHILQYTEEELNIEDVVFDIEQLDFTVDGKFKDWRITNDLEVEWHRALLQNEEWWTRMFNINRYTRACEWRTEPNALKATVEMMKYDKRYEWKTNNWDIRPFFFNMLTWKRLPFY